MYACVFTCARVYMYMCAHMCVCVCIHICVCNEHFSVIKENEVLPFAVTWMDLEILMLSEVRQRKTNTAYHLYVESKKK